MNKSFFDRLKAYFVEVGNLLRGEAVATSVFPNAADIGCCRERIYAEFLKNHLPSSCNIIFGGFLFNTKGKESGQLDIIVTSDTSPQYKHFGEKSFACVEGCIAVVSIKSNLDKPTLINALENIASIPEKNPIETPEDSIQFNNPLRIDIPVEPDEKKLKGNNRWLLERGFSKGFYANWPYKIVYAHKGIDAKKLYSCLNDFYEKRSDIAHHQKPDIIHVGGEYYFEKKITYKRNAQGKPGEIESCEYKPYMPDFFALLKAVIATQDIYASSRFVKFNYLEIFNQMVNVHLQKKKAAATEEVTV